MIQTLFILFFLNVFLATNALALVEYEDNEPAHRSRRSMKSSARNSIKKKSAPQSRSSAGSAKSSNGVMDFLAAIKLKSHYQSEEIKMVDESAKLKKYQFNLHSKLLQSIYVDINYQMVATDSETLATTSQYQKGNPEVIFGINWIGFGGRGDRTNLDMLIGHRWGQKGSEFGSSRSDFILGVQSFKAIGNFAIGLGYQLEIKGKAKALIETDTGNFHIIKASLGAVVSPDIQMALHAQRITIKSSQDSKALNTLDEDLQFTILNPELVLSISPSFSLNLGGHFRSQSPRYVKKYNYLRTPHINGLWGNTIYTGLGVSF